MLLERFLIHGCVLHQTLLPVVIQQVFEQAVAQLGAGGGVPPAEESGAVLAAVPRGEARAVQRQPVAGGEPGQLGSGADGIQRQVRVTCIVSHSRAGVSLQFPVSLG